MSQQDKGMITRNDIFQSWLRWLFFAHANYNWERYQGTGFAHAMTPIIKKLYKTPEDIKAALKRHLVFFNTEPDTGGVIHGMTIALEEQRAMGNTDIDDETINNVKMGLMGPLAGLGDTLKQGIWFPVFQALGIGLALSGAGLIGPLVYFVAGGLYTFAFGWWVYYQGYVQGQALVGRLLQTGLLDDIRTGASVLAAVVLAALGAQFVTVSTGLTVVIPIQAEGAQPKTFPLQTELLNKLFPALLPLITILLIVWLLRRGSSVVNVVIYLFGISLASVLIESVAHFADLFKSIFGVVSPITQAQVDAGAFAADKVGQVPGIPTLVGVAVLVVGALWAGSRARNTGAAVRFIVGFAVIAVLFAVWAAGTNLSVFLQQPIQIFSHF